MNETELINSEIGYFIRPKQSKWKTAMLDIAVILAIIAFASLLYWLGSTGAL
jgi:hypothetical protein